MDGAAIVRLAQRLIGIGLRRSGGRRRPDRPARLVADAAGRPQFIGKAKTGAAFAERGDFERELRATGAGAGNRLDPDQFRAFLDRTGFQACDLGLGPPRFALGGLKNPRPQPAKETRTKEPTRYKRTPRVIRARSANLFKDSSTR